MQRFQNPLNYVFLVFSLFYLNALAQFNLSATGEAGYESGVYFPKDSAYGSSFFLSPSAEASYTATVNPDWTFEGALPASFTLRREGNNDKSVEAGAAFQPLAEQIR